MNEAEHVVRLLAVAKSLGIELADAYDPDRDNIIRLCQEAEDHIVKIYRWANALQKDE
jgi:hypothetical protein